MLYKKIRSYALCTAPFWCTAFAVKTSLAEISATAAAEKKDYPDDVSTSVVSAASAVVST